MAMVIYSKWAQSIAGWAFINPLALPRGLFSPHPLTYTSYLALQAIEAVSLCEASVGEQKDCFAI